MRLVLMKLLNVIVLTFFLHGCVKDEKYDGNSICHYITPDDDTLEFGKKYAFHIFTCEKDSLKQAKLLKYKIPIIQNTIGRMYFIAGKMNESNRIQQQTVNAEVVTIKNDTISGKIRFFVKNRR